MAKRKVTPTLPEIARLRHARLEDNLTYRELGQILQLSMGSIHNLLDGRRKPMERTLFRIRKFLEARERLAS